MVDGSQERKVSSNIQGTVSQELKVRKAHRQEKVRLKIAVKNWAGIVVDFPFK